MRTFILGALVALILTGGTAYLYRLAGVTSVEHSSPARSVRVDDNASNSAKGTGYGVPRKQAADNRQPKETARR